MSAHCDSADGPVVTAAREALEKGQVELALPYVAESAHGEVRAAFHRAIRARKLGDLHFVQTVVRVHREGEGVPYRGVKPAVGTREAGDGLTIEAERRTPHRPPQSRSVVGAA